MWHDDVKTDPEGMLFSTGYRHGVPFKLPLKSIGHGHALAINAAHAFLRMQEAAAAAGVALVVNTAFRSMEHQQLLYEEYTRKLDKWLLAPVEERGPKPAPAAKPGFSLHQSGVSVDINRGTGDDPRTAEADSPIDDWLRQYAARFGFRNDVPSEPWHWSWSKNDVV